jgi:hypothetical protein
MSCARCRQEYEGGTGGQRRRLAAPVKDHRRAGRDHRRIIAAVTLLSSRRQSMLSTQLEALRTDPPGPLCAHRRRVHRASPRCSLCSAEESAAAVRTRLRGITAGGVEIRRPALPPHTPPRLNLSPPWTSGCASLFPSPPRWVCCCCRWPSTMSRGCATT